jgi:hypothetical protein
MDPLSFNYKVVQSNTQQYIQYCKACYMFRLQVTNIRQTFQYMGMTCPVLTVWDLHERDWWLVAVTE